MQNDRRNRKPKQMPKSNKLSDHFSKRDFSCKCGKCDTSLRISLGLLGGLEFLRSISKNRIQIIKGYECPDSAEKSSKIKRNYHSIGVAADITIERRTVQEAFLLAEEVPEFLGIGLDLQTKTLHVDTRKEKKRSLWVITPEGEDIPLTDENRAHYLPAPNTPHESLTTPTD
jgi:hypothetical protein